MNINYHKKKSNCFLYSVNSYLAHWINENFYQGIHYVWCTPLFNCENNPPSSNPKEIYNSLIEDVKRQDKHSDKIRKNKLGLLKGTEKMFELGIITQKERDDILLIIREASINKFSPLLYIIDLNQAGKKFNPVPREERANILSDEYIIKNLYTDEFDVIYF